MLKNGASVNKKMGLLGRNILALAIPLLLCAFTIVMIQGYQFVKQERAQIEKVGWAEIRSNADRTQTFFNFRRGSLKVLGHQIERAAEKGGKAEVLNEIRKNNALFDELFDWVYIVSLQGPIRWEPTESDQKIKGQESGANKAVASVKKLVPDTAPKSTNPPSSFEPTGMDWTGKVLAKKEVEELAGLLSSDQLEFWTHEGRSFVLFSQVIRIRGVQKHVIGLIGLEKLLPLLSNQQRHVFVNNEGGVFTDQQGKILLGEQNLSALGTKLLHSKLSERTVPLSSGFVRLTPLSNQDWYLGVYSVMKEPSFLDWVAGVQILSVLIVFGATLLVVYLGTRRALAPVSDLVRAVQEVARGNKEALKNLGALPSELAPLQTAVHDMAQKIALREASLLESNAKYEEVARNLDERAQQLTAAARVSTQQLQQTIDAMEDGLILWDSERKMVLHNKSVERHFSSCKSLLQTGIEKDKWVSALLAEGIVPHKSGFSKGTETIAWEKGKPWESEVQLELVSMDGRQFIIKHFFTDQGYTLEFISDVSTQRSAELALTRSERMAALGALVAGVAHEINTPVGNALLVSQGQTETLSQLRALVTSKVPITKTQLISELEVLEEMSKSIAGSVARAGELVKSFKAVSADQISERRRAYNLAQVLRETATILMPGLKQKNITLSLQLEEGMEAEGYPGVISQVITALVDNAGKHAFENRDSGLLNLRVTGVKDQWAYIELKDDGVGIPFEIQRRVFDPFFTTKAGKGGTGLGLAIVQQSIVKSLGGSIEVRSIPNQGTTFYISIPLIAPTPKASKEST